MKANAIRIAKTGKPDVLKWQTVEVADPGKGEVLVKHTAIAVNFADVQRRKGITPMPVPGGMGLDAVGTIAAVGAGVKDFKPGDRVAYVGLGMPFDAYSEMRVAPAGKLLRLPKALTDRQVAGTLLKGVTAQYLIKSTYKVRKGDTILVHAAAGGVGSILCQWAKSLGATVIGVVGSQAKVAVAKRNGCRHVIVPRGGKFAARLRELTKGVGVDCVYDSVGEATWAESLASVKRHGTAVNYGGASGDVRSMDLAATGPLGGPYIVRAIMINYAVTDDETRARAGDLFRAMAGGKVKVRVGQTFKLKDAAQAHRAIEARKTTGSTVLIP
jgi:NADPH2:quinone reductase